MDAMTHDTGSVGRSADLELLMSKAQAAGAMLEGAVS